MSSPSLSLYARLAGIALALALPPACAADAGAPAFSGTDARGRAVRVPATQASSILIFVKPEQSQSRDAIRQVGAAAGSSDQFQVIIIVSGDQAAGRAAGLAAEDDCPWPVVADPDYALSGRMRVRVWPTTVVIQPSGDELAHLAGLPKTYRKELDSYLAFAAGRIARAELEQRLAAHDLVTDSPEEIALRHVQVAQRLLEKGLVEQAQAELTQGLAQHPGSVPLQLALARVLLMTGAAESALRLVEQVDPAAAGSGQINLLRGKALAQVGKHEDARAALQAAIRLNPDPSEAWYELGLIYERLGDWPRAAEAHRRAFETSPSGRQLVPSSHPTGAR